MRLPIDEMRVFRKNVVVGKAAAGGPRIVGTVSGEAVSGRRFSGVQGSLELCSEPECFRSQPWIDAATSSTATSNGITGNKIEKDFDEVATRCFDERISALTSGVSPKSVHPYRPGTPLLLFLDRFETPRVLIAEPQA